MTTYPSDPDAVTLDEEVNMLRQIPLFAEIAPSKLKFLAFACDRVLFAPGEFITRQGDQSDGAYLILQGAAEVLSPDQVGEVPIAQLGVNSFFGEAVLLHNKPAAATIRAKSKIEALKISRQLFNRVMSEFPEIAIQIMRALAARLGATAHDLQTVRDQFHPAPPLAPEHLRP